MMKRFYALCLCVGCLSIGLAGCGGPDEPSNMMQDADAKAFADYEAMIEADNAGMTDEEASDDAE
jgi:hypothetical protein